MRKRLAVYSAQTKPLVEYYAQWAARATRARRSTGRSTAWASVEAIRDACLAALEDLNAMQAIRC